MLSRLKTRSDRLGLLKGSSQIQARKSLARSSGVCQRTVSYSMILTKQQVYGKLHDCQQAIAPIGLITAIGNMVAIGYYNSL